MKNRKPGVNIEANVKPKLPAIIIPKSICPRKDKHITENFLQKSGSFLKILIA